MIEPILATLDYSAFKPIFLKTNIKPVYETDVNKLNWKFLDEAMTPSQNNFTRSVDINNNNDTFHDEKSSFKLKVKISKKDEDITNHNDNIPTQYTVANINSKYTTKNLYPEIKEEKKNDTNNIPKRTVPGFNIEGKADIRFKASMEDKIKNEKIQLLPIEYHIPVLGQLETNQAPLLAPILPSRHTLPKFIPVYQSDNLPLHIHAPDSIYSSYLDTIVQGGSPQNQFHNLEKYFRLHDSNQHSKLKDLENGNFEDKTINPYTYERNGIPTKTGHNVGEEPIKVRQPVSSIADTRRGMVNKNEEYLDAHIKIPQHFVEQYRPQIIETLQNNIANKTMNDFLRLFSQIQGNVSYRKAEDLKPTTDLHVTNSTDSLGIDTLLKQHLINSIPGKDQTETLFPQLLSILGPVLSTYFGENPLPAGKIDNEIKKLQNTLETLKKFSEFSKNITSSTTQKPTNGLPIVNRTYLTESTFIGSHLNNETQTRDTSTQTHKYKTTLNEHVTLKTPTIQFTKFLNISNKVPKNAISNLTLDITTKHAKTTTVKPDNKSYKPLESQINKHKSKNNEIKKSLDKFTMERKKTITSTPTHLEMLPGTHEEKLVDGKEIQPDRVKNIVQNWTSTPHLGLIGKVLNENYILLSQQSNKNKTTSRLPEIIDIQGNDEDIIDPKYISENPEVFDSLRKQTEIMGKLLLNYKKYSSRKKNKANNQPTKDNTMKDLEVLINKLQKEFQSKSTNNKEVSTPSVIKKIGYSQNRANNNEKLNTKEIKHSEEVSIKKQRSSTDLGARKVKPMKHSKEKLTKDIYSKEITSEKDGEEFPNERALNETSSSEVSSNETAIIQTTKTLKSKMHLSRVQKALLRNPDLLKILRYCKSHKKKKV